MRKIILICALILLGANSSFAHEDTIIEVKETKLIGLPEEYQPAELDLENKLLRIADNQIILPDCLIQYLPINNNDARVLASWYHDNRSGLPPYLNITGINQDKPIKYWVLFDMNTLELISITRITQINNNEFQYTPVENDKCTKKIVSKNVKK